MSLPVLLLAAGASSRMGGRDKLLETLGGVPLLTLMARRACAVSPDVIVALPPEPHPRHAALEGLPLTRLPVPDAAEGMGASLRAAAGAIPPGAPAALLLLADTPDLTEDDLRAVIAARERHPEALVWRGATEDGAPGHPVIFDAALFPALRRLSGDRGAREVVAAAAPRVHLTPLPGQHARTDLDTPEAWAEWRARRGILS